jgi:hypothetical protein
MGHSRPDTTQLYTDEIQLDELAQSLARALLARNAQASPDLATLESDVAAALQSLEWRRRESNPRDSPHRISPPPRHLVAIDWPLEKRVAATVTENRSGGPRFRMAPVRDRTAA